MNIDLGYTPRGWQRQAHEGRKRFSVLVLHRRAGKTVFAILELLLSALACPNGHFAYIAPFYSQAKSVGWDTLKEYALRVPGCDVRESELKITLPNGAWIRLFGADNGNSLRGLGFDGAVVDEVADIEPSFTGEILRPALSDRRGWCLYIGTAKGINLFSQVYFEALKDPDNWFAMKLTVYETGALDPEEVEATRRDMSEAQFAQEYLCEFSAGGSNVLIPGERISVAAERHLADTQYGFAARVLGVDPARFGDDSTCIIVRQGLWAHDLVTFRGLDTMQVADEAVSRARQFDVDAVFVDGVGLGAGVVDRMRQLGMAPVDVNFSSRPTDPRYANKRAQCWSEMADWLKWGAIPDDQQLRLDLSAPTYRFNAANQIVLESKDEMKKRGMKSPDAADALALTFASPVVPRLELDGVRLTPPRRGQALHDYDPFSESSN